MKLAKMLLALMTAALLVVPVAAETAYDYNASGSTVGAVGETTAGGDLGYVANRRIVIDSIWAKSDLSTSVVRIYIGAATGATDNYTQVHDIDLGDATELFQLDGKPLFVGPKDYQMKVDVTSTDKNSISVNWHRE